MQRGRLPVGCGNLPISYCGLRNAECGFFVHPSSFILPFRLLRDDGFIGSPEANRDTGAFEKAAGRHIPYRVVARRPGDIAVCYADPSKIREALGWSAEYGLDRMVADSWRWQEHNPQGYSG